MNEPVSSARRGRQHPIVSLTAARVLEFFREPEAVFWMYVFPLFLVLALGAAFRNRPVEAFRVSVVAGPKAERVTAALNADKRFKAVVSDDADARLRLRSGRADLVLAAASGPRDEYVYSYDPTRAASVLARNAADDLLQRAAGRRDVLATKEREVNEPGGRYIDFLVPGLLGMGLMGGGMWGVGYAIVDMRIRKLLKRYLATPMKRSHFLASVIGSRILFALPEVVLLLVFARLVFDVRSEGSHLAIGLLIVLGALQFSGIGLLVASRAQTIEAISGLMNAVMLPMWIGSGIFFSNERFPEAVQPLLFLLPLTPLIHAMRSIMLEGATLIAVWADLAIIAAWIVMTFVLALRWFRWH